jgi:hypothetical protein
LNYPFSVTETAFVLDALNEVSGLNWQIEDAQGIVVYRGVYGVDQSRRINLTSGNYTLRFTAQDVATNANAAISFKLANLKSAAIPLTLNTRTNGTLSDYGVSSYQFTVSTPVNLWLDAITASAGVDWQIDDARGETVYSGVFGASQNVLISLVSGSYTLKYLSRDVFSNANAVIAFKWADVDSATLSITSDERIQGALNADNGLVVYQFDGRQVNTFQLNILRAVMFAEFMVESFYSRARRIAGYVTVSATPLSDKMADQKTANVTARSIPAEYIKLKRKEKGLPVELTFLKKNATDANINFDKKAKDTDIYHEIVEKMKDRNDDFCNAALSILKNDKLQILQEV